MLHKPVGKHGKSLKSLSDFCAWRKFRQCARRFSTAGVDEIGQSLWISASPRCSAGLGG
ncbi:hypothetical protein [Xanthomonas translucens]|uniref:hypothetical protein n=1 Tax=Xanthomonas campestris pv. translucens TaxID=343 RepID=UPI000A7EC715|nr:hypothetical protein [Xanthomonas translucens]